jgi:hypothetical protein
VVQSLYSQVENALELIVAPADPDQLRASGTAGAANAAALTNQYLGALNQLNNAQSQMYRIWLSYLATRMQLYLDLERLPLDLRGVWIDEPRTGTELPHPRAVDARDGADSLRHADRGGQREPAERAEPVSAQRPAAFAPGGGTAAGGRARLLAPAAARDLE